MTPASAVDAIAERNQECHLLEIGQVAVVLVEDSLERPGSLPGPHPAGYA